MDNIIHNHIRKHLVDNGFSDFNASISATKAIEFYKITVCNNKDAYKEMCDYAGELAHEREVNVKYKPPKPKVKTRYKRPPSALDF